MALVPPISPAEILKNYLQANVVPTIVAIENIVVGPLGKEQQETGGISLANDGLPVEQPGLPVVWLRARIRVLASQYEKQDEISRHVWELCKSRNRVIVRDAYGRDWLVHVLKIIAGPSDRKDANVEEGLMFVHMMIGTEPL